MSEYMTLLGAETVQNAASRMKDAANEMNRAAANIEDAFFRNQQAMDLWLIRFEEILSRVRPDAAKPEEPQS